MKEFKERLIESLSIELRILNPWGPNPNSRAPGKSSQIVSNSRRGGAPRADTGLLVAASEAGSEDALWEGPWHLGNAARGDMTATPAVPCSQEYIVRFWRYGHRQTSTHQGEFEFGRG